MNDHLDEHQLNELADGSLSARASGAAEAHLAACAGCRDRVEGVLRLRASLRALPREIPPPPRVLAGVHAAIASAAARQPWYARPALAAAAAIALVVVSSVTTALLMRNSPDAPPLANDAPAGSVRLVAVHAMEQSYEDAISGLQRTLAEQQTTLAPETRRAIELNLAIIDRALAEARAALRADPANEGLADLLRSGYERKLDVLRSVTAHTRASS